MHINKVFNMLTRLDISIQIAQKVRIKNAHLLGILYVDV